MSITGSIRLEATDLDGPSAVLFLIARGGGGGPPLAVRKLPAGPFPVEFEIGPEHVMIPGTPFSGPIQLTARLDADGDAMTRSESDLESAGIPGLEPGDAGVELVLRGASRPAREP